MDTRMNPDTFGRGDSICIWICVDAESFKSGKKSLRIRKYPDTCGRGLSLRFSRNVLTVGHLKIKDTQICPFGVCTKFN